MPKRMLRVLDNGRHVTRGLVQPEPWGKFVLQIAEGETDLLRVDLNAWLDSGETVASSALSDEQGVTLAKANGSTWVDLTVSGVTGYGSAKLAITTSASRVKVIELGFEVPQAQLVPADPWRWSDR